MYAVRPEQKVYKGKVIHNLTSGEVILNRVLGEPSKLISNILEV